MVLGHLASAPAGAQPPIAAHGRITQDRTRRPARAAEHGVGASEVLQTAHIKHPCALQGQRDQSKCVLRGELRRSGTLTCSRTGMLSYSILAMAISNIITRLEPASPYQPVLIGFPSACPHAFLRPREADWHHQCRSADSSRHPPRSRTSRSASRSEASTSHACLSSQRPKISPHSDSQRSTARDWRLASSRDASVVRRRTPGTSSWPRRTTSSWTAFCNCLFFFVQLVQAAR